MADNNIKEDNKNKNKDSVITRDTDLSKEEATIMKRYKNKQDSLSTLTENNTHKKTTEKKDDDSNKDAEEYIEGDLVIDNDMDKDSNRREVVIKNETNEKLACGDRIELTNRIAFGEQKVAMSRLPIWYLNVLGAMSVSELEEFEASYRGKLSLNEIITLNFIKRVMNEDKNAEKQFWDIQQRMLNKTNVQNQINISVQKPDSVVSNLLDEIANKIKGTD